MNANPARIRFVFAAAAPVAVILRRGPSKWVHVLKWETRTDSIEPGAWFHGRIDADLCDLSPDGLLFAYRAAQYGNQHEPGYDDIWTAVSKPPWLTALAMWPRDDTWGGRAVFLDDRRLTIERPHWEGPLVPHPKHLPQEIEATPRWIGRDAPDQSLPKPAEKKARFVPESGKGHDHDGRPFFLKDGQLFRDVSDIPVPIADFRLTMPRRTSSPAWARTW